MLLRAQMNPAFTYTSPVCVHQFRVIISSDLQNLSVKCCAALTPRGSTVPDYLKPKNKRSFVSVGKKTEEDCI